MVGTHVGQRSVSEVEHLMRDGFDLSFDTKDDGLFILVTWDSERACVQVLCHHREKYNQDYTSLQLLRDAQPWDLSRFTIVERIRDDEEV